LKNDPMRELVVLGDMVLSVSSSLAAVQRVGHSRREPERSRGDDIYAG
jgi:hypothetical protein